jgi:hypothetical protein
VAARPDDDPLGARALLERGVAAGVISVEQRDALLALPLGASEPTAFVSGDEHVRRAVDGVAIAYGVGAALVVFALGWFLADRWEPLGPGGVLLVAALYATLFGAAARRLARTGFPLGAGVACALVTLTAPLAAWALLRLTGEWPGGSPADPLLTYEPYMITRHLVLELSAALAVLLFLRALPPGERVRRTPLAVPLAVATAFVLAECLTLVAIATVGTDVRIYGWSYGTAGALLFGVAFETDRRQPPAGDRRREDFAGWLYAAACVLFEAGLLDGFGLGERARHGLALVALLQLASAARLRRRTLLLAGAVNAVWYLGWLAFDVFKGVLSFSLLLAAFGVAVLLGTVWIQRRFPTLLRRENADWRPPSLPGGPLVAWAPAVVTIMLLAVVAPRARAERVRVERSHPPPRSNRTSHRPAPRPTP